MRPWRLALPILVALALAPQTSAEAQSLDDLQKQIDTGRKKRQEKAEPAQASGAAQLVLSSDASCVLRIDGQKVADLVRDQPQTISVQPGEALIDCTSTEEPAARVGEVRTIRSGEKTVLMLSMAGRVREVRSRAADKQKRAEEEQRQAAEEQLRVKEEARRANEARGIASSYQTVVSGVLLDLNTGLEWTVQDNGRNISWSNARTYCENRGGSWRLPSVDELQGLVDRTKMLWTPCGPLKCGVSPAFKLTEPTFWSNERNGPSEAWSVIFELGAAGRVSLSVGYAAGQRALCVRRP